MFGGDRAQAADTVSAKTLGIGGLFDHLRDAVVVADDAGRIVLWNPAASSIFGYSAEEAVGQNVEMLVPPELRPQHRDGLAQWRLTGKGRYVDSGRPFELPARGRDGSALQVELTLSPLDPGTGRRYVLAMARDVTARKALEAELVQRSLRDELTDLPNRTLFLDTVRRGLVHATWRKHGLAVLVVDLARFAELRASLGEEAADNLLAQVGQRLAQAMRAEDMVARLEADLFGVLLQSLEAEAAADAAADRLLALLQTPFRVGRRRIVLSACIGIALSGTSRQPPEELLRDAELALLEAKRDGAASWHRYDRSITAPVTLDSLGLDGDLRLAIERDEFVVHYQPILRLADASLFGFEALARWRHPSRGLLDADEFIVPAERLGLIGQIDAWVLREACGQAAAWQEARPGEPPLTMAVNISAGELHGDDVADRVRIALAEHGLSPGSLMLEITETTALFDPVRAARVLDDIRGTGVRVAIDDFGAGSHALSHLRYLRLDALKLDRGFVAAINDGRTAAIVAAVITLAHELGMDVVGEGVETTEQAHRLRQLECDLAQGHLLSRAVPATEATELLVRADLAANTAGRPIVAAEAVLAGTR
jgi:PAS domain S-box-containing protein/diguanylate cyclase (GGDEF)-like protein